MENRREFIRNGLIFGLAAGGALAGCAARPFPHTAEAQWGMIIDTRRCTGCQSCMVACKLQSATAPNHFNTTITDREMADGGRTRIAFEPDLCRHCSDPPCVAVCSTGAAFKHPSGLTLTDWSRCDGNGACIPVCPYEARFADPRFDRRTDKCDLCVGRLAEGLSPACVENCSAGARIFGRFDAPEGEFARYLVKLGIPAAESRRPAAVLIHHPSRKEAAS